VVGHARGVQTTSGSGADRARRAARRSFLAGERLDVGRLADELGVNRATLYRWVGTRDELLVEVLWSLADRLFADLRAQTGGAGGDRVVAVVTGFVDRVISARGMQRFLAQEGELALRLLTRADRGFQPRLVGAVRALVAEEGLDDLPVDVDELAFVIVRILESYIYLDLLTGRPPQAERVEPVLRLLLR
jgi:AcrR family transcriptional regulator